MYLAIRTAVQDGPGPAPCRGISVPISGADLLPWLHAGPGALRLPADANFPGPRGVSALRAACSTILVGFAGHRSNLDRIESDSQCLAWMLCGRGVPGGALETEMALADAGCARRRLSCRPFPAP